MSDQLFPAVRDAFSAHVREVGRLAGEVEMYRHRWESAQAQSDHHLAEKLQLQAELEHARRDAMNERATSAALRRQLEQLEKSLKGETGC